MKCPSCGAADLLNETRDVPYTYKAESTIIPAVTADFCPACGEVLLNREQGDRYSHLIGLFQRKVNAVFKPGEDADLGAVADAAKSAADRACGAIDDALAFIAASNARIKAMEDTSGETTPTQTGAKI